MKIVLTGGGTAGHVNPAIAVAKYIQTQDPSAEIRFGGAQGGIEEKLVGREGFMLYTYPVKGLQRSLSPTGILLNCKAVGNVFSSIAKAKRDLQQWKPDIVVGTGGYASFPMVYAAARLGIKTAMLEVNATPGVALKYLSSMVDSVMLSFEETRALVPKAKHTVFTGGPIRGDIAKPNPTSFVFHNGKPTVLCFWGSVGAQYMNEKGCDFLKLAAEAQQFNVLYAAGARDYGWMPEKLEKAGVNLKQASNIKLVDYIYDMGSAMGESSLIICRGGASSLAETLIAGKPSIIVPSPYVTDNHQEKNARALENLGCSVVQLEKSTTGQSLFQLVSQLLGSPEKLAGMAQCARDNAIHTGTENIYTELCRLTGQNPDNR